jgi:hypothetical protein
MNITIALDAKFDLSEAAAALGKKGGSAKSDKKAAAVRENGRKGGRPRGQRVFWGLVKFRRVQGNFVRVGPVESWFAGTKAEADAFARRLNKENGTDPCFIQPERL